MKSKLCVRVLTDSRISLSRLLKWQQNFFIFGTKWRPKRAHVITRQIFLVIIEKHNFFCPRFIHAVTVRYAWFCKFHIPYSKRNYNTAVKTLGLLNWIILWAFATDMNMKCCFSQFHELSSSFSLFYWVISITFQAYRSQFSSLVWRRLGLRNL